LFFGDAYGGSYFVGEFMLLFFGFTINGVGAEMSEANL
jgi:hypothetical protein